MTYGRNPQIDHDIDWVIDEDGNVLGYMRDPRSMTRVVTVDQDTGLITDPAQRAAVGEAVGSGFSISVFRFMTDAQIADVQSRAATIDLTSVFANAVAFIAALGGGELYFPPGKYRGSITLQDVSNITLRGAGIGDSVLYLPAQTYSGNSLVIIKAVTTDIRNVRVIGLSMKSSAYSNTYDAFGLECNRDTNVCVKLAYNILVSDCEVDSVDSAGIVVRNCIGATITRNVVSNTGRDGIQMVAQNGIATHNVVTNAGDDGIAGNGTYSPAAFTPSYVITNNCINHQRGGRGIAVAGSGDAIVANNIIRGWWIHGVVAMYDVNAANCFYTPRRITISDNLIFESASTWTSRSGIGLYAPVDQAAFPADNFVDYPSRTLLDQTKYPASHINIRGNFIGSTEYKGKTVDGITYQDPRYGVRFVAPGAFQNVTIEGNQFYGMSSSGIQCEQSANNEYGVSKLRILGNDFRACAIAMVLTGGAPSGSAWVNDVLVVNNTIDGKNSLGYASPKGIQAYGVRKLMIQGNSFANLTTQLDASSSSYAAYGNFFDTATGVFGQGAHVYVAASNAWNEYGPVVKKMPVIVTTATYTPDAQSSTLTFNVSGTCTLTLPNPYYSPGLVLELRTITANTVVSASSNVVPQAGGSAGTAILPATAGKWAILQSDGGYWQIVASGG